MAILEGCCCFSTVRKGSYACAFYTMVYDCLSLVILPMFIHHERNYYIGNDTKPKSSSFLEPESISPTTMVFNILMLLNACLSLIASFLLLYGLQKDNRIFLVPWVMLFGSQTLLDIVYSIYLIAVNIENGINPIATIIYTFDFLLFALNIYGLLCVISQYEEYRAGRGTSDYDPQKPRVKYISGQTGISCLSTRKPGTYHETTNSPTLNHSTIMPSTILSADDLQSSPHKQRRGSHKHVKFGSFDDARYIIVSTPPGGRTDQNDLRNCLGVVTEEPSWIMGENSSGTPLCVDNSID